MRERAQEKSNRDVRGLESRGFIHQFWYVPLKEKSANWLINKISATQAGEEKPLCDSKGSNSLHSDAKDSPFQMIRKRVQEVLNCRESVSLVKRRENKAAD